MPPSERHNRSRLFPYFPILAVMIFWLGADVISSLLVATPHLTQLGFVTLPLVAAALAAGWTIHRGRGRKEVPEKRE